MTDTPNAERPSAADEGSRAPKVAKAFALERATRCAQCRLLAGAMFAAIAEFERKADPGSLERRRARAKVNGVHFGRKGRILGARRVRVSG